MKSAARKTSAAAYEERLRLQFASLDAIVTETTIANQRPSGAQLSYKVIMIATAANAYQQTHVMTANRVQLIVLLYDSAIQSMELARKPF
jgi:hypothetical protein